MTSTRRIIRPLVTCAIAAATSIVTGSAALAYPAPPDPDPAIQPPATTFTTGSSHTLQWALTGLSGFLFLILVSMTAAVVATWRRHRRLAAASASSPVSIPSVRVPETRTSETSATVRLGLSAQPKR
jgi:hypothetical protein